MLEDEQFDRLFPDAQGERSLHEFDPRWQIMTTSISAHLSRVTGLPNDFQFQRATQANAHHHGLRNAMGLLLSRPDGDDE
jgi:hypothetical protein